MDCKGFVKKSGVAFFIIAVLLGVFVIKSVFSEEPVSGGIIEDLDGDGVLDVWFSNNKANLSQLPDKLFPNETGTAEARIEYNWLASDRNIWVGIRFPSATNVNNAHALLCDDGWNCDTPITGWSKYSDVSLGNGSWDVFVRELSVVEGQNRKLKVFFDSDVTEDTKFFYDFCGSAGNFASDVAECFASGSRVTLDPKILEGDFRKGSDIPATAKTGEFFDRDSGMVYSCDGVENDGLSDQCKNPVLVGKLKSKHVSDNWKIKTPVLKNVTFEDDDTVFGSEKYVNGEGNVYGVRFRKIDGKIPNSGVIDINNFYFEDGERKSVDDMASLNRFYKGRYLEWDGVNNLSIIDLNKTSIELLLETDGSEVPFKVDGIQVDTVDYSKNVVLPFDNVLEHSFTLGFESSTLNVTSADNSTFEGGNIHSGTNDNQYIKSFNTGETHTVASDDGALDYTVITNQRIDLDEILGGGPGAYTIDNLTESIYPITSTNNPYLTATELVCLWQPNRLDDALGNQSWATCNDTYQSSAGDALWTSAAATAVGQIKPECLGFALVSKTELPVVDNWINLDLTDKSGLDEGGVQRMYDNDGNVSFVLNFTNTHVGYTVLNFNGEQHATLSPVWHIEYSLLNTAPTNPVVTLNFTNDNTNFTNESMWCEFTVSDTDAEAQMYVNLSLLNNTADNDYAEQWNLSMLPYNDETTNSIEIVETNFTKDDYVVCQVEVCDDEGSCSSPVNSSSLLVQNYPVKISDPLGSWSIDEDFTNFSLDWSGNITDPDFTEGDDAVLNWIINWENTEVLGATVVNSTDVISIGSLPNVTGAAVLNINVTDEDGAFFNETVTWTVNAVNDAPVTPLAVLNFTYDNTNYTNESMWCEFYVDDIDSATMSLDILLLNSTTNDIDTAVLQWRLDDAFTGVADESYVQMEILEGNFTKDDYVWCQAVANDGTSDSDYVNSTVLGVENYPVKISDPLGSWSIDEDFTNFSLDWSGNVTDPDFDEGIDVFYWLFFMNDTEILGINSLDNATDVINIGSLSNVSGSVSIDFNVTDASDGSGAFFNETVIWIVNADNDPPIVPLLDSPVNMSNITSLSFAWSNTTDIDSTFLNYSLQIDESPGFTEPVTHYNGSIAETANTTQEVSASLSDGSYFWRVLATDGTSNSSWSEPWYFSYDPTLPNITLISPANNASLAVNTEHSFEFNVTDTNDVNCTFIVDGTTQTMLNSSKNATQTFNTTFVENADYYWYINCTDEFNNENTSVRRLLTIYSPSEGIVDTGGGEQGGGAPSATVGYNISFICSKIYEFKVATGFDHSFGDVLELQDEVFDEKTIIISLPTLTEFINNYETVCENITPSLKKEVEEEEIKVLEENGTPKDVGLLDIDIPLIDKERGFDNLITGRYLYIPYTRIGVNFHKTVGFLTPEINIGKIRALEIIRIEDEENKAGISGYKILNFFFETSINGENIYWYPLRIKVWFLTFLTLSTIIIWRWRGVPLNYYLKKKMQGGYSIVEEALKQKR